MRPDKSRDKPDKETDQVLFEDLADEFARLRELKYISCESASLDDPNRKIMTLQNQDNEEVIIRFLLNGSLAGRKARIKQALLDYDESLFERD